MSGVSVKRDAGKRTAGGGESACVGKYAGSRWGREGTQDGELATARYSF